MASSGQSGQGEGSMDHSEQPIQDPSLPSSIQRIMDPGNVLPRHDHGQGVQCMETA